MINDLNALDEARSSICQEDQKNDELEAAETPIASVQFSIPKHRAQMERNAQQVFELT